MSINSYSGLQGSGKTYEVVSSIIVPAVSSGRRVVTNIRGIDNDNIRAYCCEKFDLSMDAVGMVISVSDEDVASKNFFPTEHSYSDTQAKSIVEPGDLVAVDEAYKIWGGDCKIHNEHKVFFREHRHYAHLETGVTCDIVIMTQDINDLHRVLKVVIEQSFKTHKAKGVGLNSVYTITMWEGYKQVAKHIVKDWTQTYKPEFFPLYQSYAGNKQGKETATDARQNIFADRKLVYKIVFFIAIAAFILWRIIHYWMLQMHPELPVKSSAPVSVVAGSVTLPTTPPPPAYSTDWRLAGEVVIGGKKFILLSGIGGHFRLETPLLFIGQGFNQVGMIDGLKVTPFSGPSFTQPSGGGLLK